MTSFSMDLLSCLLSRNFLFSVKVKSLFIDFLLYKLVGACLILLVTGFL